jgi:hypothetical protein
MPCKQDIEYPFEHGEVINSTLDGVTTQAQSLQRYWCPNSVVGEEGNRSGISPGGQG